MNSGVPAIVVNKSKTKRCPTFHYFILQNLDSTLLVIEMVIKEQEGLAYNTMSRLEISKHGGKAKVTNLDLCQMTIDEDVVTFEVSVDDRRIVLMQVDKAIKNLACPVLDCSNVHSLVSFPIPAFDDHLHGT